MRYPTSRRFSSLAYAPAETRIRLRDRLSRFLPSHPSAPPLGQTGAFKIADEILLDLLLDLEITYGSEENAAREAYAADLSQAPNQPSFDALVEDHWVRVIWQRIYAPHEIQRAVQQRPSDTLPALDALLKRRFEKAYHIVDAARDKVELSSIVAAIERAEINPESIGCQAPEWVAARLWDRAPRHEPDNVTALRLWVDRWRLLGSPSLVPTEAWSDEDAAAFWNAAVEMIEFKAGLVGWNEMRAGFIKQLAAANDRPSPHLDTYFPPPPTTLVDRALWIETNRGERAIMQTLEASESVGGIVRLLLNWIEAAAHSTAPHPFAEKLFTLAIEKAELFINLMFQLRARPKLLADVLLNAPTSALGCLLVGQWHVTGGAWDRELTSHDDEATKAWAFADAVAVMGWHLREGSLDPAEAAALFKWVYRTATPGFIDPEKEPMLRTLRTEFLSQSSDILSAMVAALAVTMPETGLGTLEFAAVIDIIDIGKLAGHGDPEPLVVAYVRSVMAGHFGLAANRIGLSGAVTLFELAASRPDLRQIFLHPIDIKAQLVARAEENPFSVEDDLCRSLRVHIRILCRAIAGYVGQPAQDLVDALIDAVKQGALKHSEKARIPAFAPRHESNALGVALDRPIAADLGDALTALADDNLERLMTVILETDEPMVLAQLLNFAPFSLRQRIEKCIEQILPSDAGDIRSLPEAQARIEALLATSASEAAARFIDAEQGLKTFGKVPGREMNQLRSKLRLLFTKGDWAEIAKTEPPKELSPQAKAAAVETISFYRALAAMNDPTGDHRGAEQLFAQLQDRKPDVTAYVINLFAARIGLLLDGNLFAELQGDALLRGRLLLADAEKMMRHVRLVTPDDTAIFNSNKGILLLALRRPQQALELLASLRNARLTDAIAAYAL